MDKNYIWIGPRSSDIINDTFFSNSITTYGSNKYSFCSNQRLKRGTVEEKIFIEQSMSELYNQNPNTYFMLYDQSEIADFSSQIRSQIICVNELSIIKLLNSKEFTRTWLSNDMDCLPFIIMPFSDCNYVRLCRFFPGVSSFVIQNTYGAGGTKTYLIKNDAQIETIKKSNNLYDVSIASPFLKNSLSLNVHILCGRDSYILFPYSTQIIEQHKRCILYSGSDFIRKYNENIKDKISQASHLIAKKLVNLGYLGIAGIDFMWSNNVLYFTEINPRFQGSTRLLNLWLLENGFTSIYKMNIDAFKGILPSYNFENIQIPYISYNSMYNVRKKYNINPSCVLMTQDMDGWNLNIKDENGIYQFRNIYKLNQ